MRVVFRYKWQIGFYIACIDADTNKRAKSLL